MKEKSNTMEPEIKIDKSIPIPVSRAKWEPIAKSMKIGDSVLLPGRHKANTLGAYLRKIQGKPVVRMDGEGFRVWRTA